MLVQNSTNILLHGCNSELKYNIIFLKNNMVSAESLTTPFRWRISMRIHSDHHGFPGEFELEHSSSIQCFKSWILQSSNILDRSSACKMGKEWLKKRGRKWNSMCPAPASHLTKTLGLHIPEDGNPLRWSASPFLPFLPLPAIQA